MIVAQLYRKQLTIKVITFICMTYVVDSFATVLLLRYECLCEYLSCHWWIDNTDRRHCFAVASVQRNKMKRNSICLEEKNEFEGSSFRQADYELQCLRD